MPNERGDRPLQLVVLGNPASRRVRGFVDAARRSGSEGATVVSFADYLLGRAALPAGSLVRIESPGESWDVEKLILKAGIRPMEETGRVPVCESNLDNKPAGRGEIHHPLQWFLGFESILWGLERDGDAAGIHWMSSPREVATMFDKEACRQRWLAAALPVPAVYPGISTYAQLRSTVRERHARLFVKLRYGYSAMGAMALEWRGPLIRAITTVDVDWLHGRPRLFLTKKPRILRREFEIAWLIDTLGMEEIVVEDWLPKARWQGRSFDLRVVMIGGQAAHVVGRASSSPFTNLNLDSTRISSDDVERHLGASWPELLTLSAQAAAVFPESTSFGLDVLVRPCRRRWALLEANAFGDYLPGLLHHGESTYEAELRHILCREGACA